jgi:hypothetical protein
MVKRRIDGTTNATASIVADRQYPIGLRPRRNLRSALSLMARRLGNEYVAGVGREQPRDVYRTGSLALRQPGRQPAACRKVSARRDKTKD